MQKTEFPVTAPNNLRALERLLEQVLDKHPGVAHEMSEALMICRGRHGAHAGINLQLQGALISLRNGRPEDAVEFIERAINMQLHWAGNMIT